MKEGIFAFLALLATLGAVYYMIVVRGEDDDEN